jgi:hypothetical protein
MRRAATVVMLVVLSALPARATFAIAAGGGGKLHHGGKVDVGIIIATPGVSTPIDVRGHSATQPIVWTVVGNDHPRPGDLSALCAPGPIDPAHPVFGVTYRLIGTTLDGRVVGEQIECVPIVDPTGPSPAPVLPVMPTIEATWREAHLPEPAIGLDPATRGITGLDTRIWTETGNHLVINATLNGYRVSGVADVTGYRVQVDDEPALTTDAAGSNGDPIAHHVFETKGMHTIHVGVVWHGVATFEGPGLTAPATVTIGDATITSTQSYPVHEVRAVLQP